MSNARLRPVVFAAAGCVAIAAALAIGVFLLLSNTFKEDSWQHFVNGGEFRASSPNESPDGETLIYSTSDSGNGDIYSFHDGTTRPLIATSDFESTPLWLPNGDIVFVRERNGQRHVWIHKNGQNDTEIQITDGNTLDDIISVSPAGDAAIIFRTPAASGGLGRSGASYLLSLEEKGSPPVELGAIGVFVMRGTHVAYTRIDDLDSLRLKELSTGQDKTIGRGSPISANPRGDKLIVATTGFSGIDVRLEVLDLSTNETRELGLGHAAGFVSNDDVLFYRGTSWECHIFNCSSGESTRLSAPNGVKEPAVCSETEGTAYLLVRTDNGMAVYRFSLQDSAFTLLFKAANYSPPRKLPTPAPMNQ
jgi:hypothetical protein